MDVCELLQKNNVPQPRATSRRTIRTTTSPVVTSGHRRCITPTKSSNGLVTNRAVSTERRRSPSSPSSTTPRKDTAVDYHYRKGTISNKMAIESLWPSTMRNLDVSFQSESKEKLATHHGIMMDRNSSPSCNANANVVQKTKVPIEKTLPFSRMRSPLRRKNEISENSRPIVSDSVGKKSADIITTDKAFIGRSLSLLQPRNGVCSPRRLSLDNICKPLQKPAMKNASFDDDSVDKRAKKLDQGSRSLSLGSSIPNDVLVSSSRGISPSRSRFSNPVPLRGQSPSRNSSPLRQSSSNNPTSVLSFIVDIKKGKKAASHIEDVHQLRMLYNRHLQWRYANDLADASHHLQTEKAERTFFSTWNTTSELWHSVIEKRMKLVQMRLHSKLCSVIDSQMMYLDVWDLIETDHSQSLIGVIKDLQSCTLRLPVTGGARGDIPTVKAAVRSAIDVFRAMGSSIGILLSQTEKMCSLVSEVADVVAQERAMLDECEALLGSTLAMQVEEDSLRIHLLYN